MNTLDSPDGVRDIHTLLRRSAEHFGDAIALVSPTGQTISYQQLFARTREIIHYLHSQGLRGGADASRVAIVMPNGINMSMALLSVSSMAIAVPFNPAYREDEYAAYFEQCKVNFLLVCEMADSAAIRVARRQGIAVLNIGHLLHGDCKGNSMTAVENNARPTPEDVGLILLTSGSTGRAKVVPLTHRNLCSAAEFVCRSVELTREDRCLSMWEQFHIGGVVDLLLAPLLSGGSVISAGSFNATVFFDVLPKHRPTWFQGVPTTLHELCVNAKHRNLIPQNSSLRFIRSVAAALPQSWQQEIVHVFGVPVIRTLGMTEASPLICSTKLPPHPDKPGSVGNCCGPTVSIMDTSGNALPSGHHGEVAIRGENVFAGYEGDTAENAALFRDGWFYTGDIGYFDEDGDLFLSGRIKEMINRGGEKISPKEVDDIILMHPDVEQAAAFAVPHPTLGEEVGIAVVLRRGAVEDASALKNLVSRHLADFKAPAVVMFVQDLPRCPVGKVRRQELVQLYQDRSQNKGVRAAPGNALERELLSLWMEELDVHDIGIDDDFSEIGGDSLSSLRIILAAEKMFGIKIPDNEIKRFDTVRQMATILTELGCVTNPLSEDDAIDSSGQSRSLRNKMKKDLLLNAVTAAMVGRDAVSPSALFDCNTVLAFDTVRHMSENISTPFELHVLLNYRPSLAAYLRWLFSGNLFTKIEIARKRQTMRQDFFKTLAAAIQPMQWSRTAVGEHVDLFTTTQNSKKEKTLIIGFTSRAMRLSTPTYQVLCCLSPEEHDLLLLRDPFRNHYREGIPEIGKDIPELAKWLDDYVRRCGYLRVTTMGTSSGAVPAICVAILNRWAQVLACGADSPSHHPHLDDLLNSLAKALDAMPEIILAYSARNRRDVAGAEDIKRRLPLAMLKPDPRFKEHSLIHQLHLKGELRDFLQNNLFYRH